MPHTAALLHPAPRGPPRALAPLLTAGAVLVSGAAVAWALMHSPSFFENLALVEASTALTAPSVHGLQYPAHGRSERRWARPTPAPPLGDRAGAAAMPPPLRPGAATPRPTAPAPPAEPRGGGAYWLALPVAVVVAGVVRYLAAQRRCRCGAVTLCGARA